MTETAQLAGMLVSILGALVTVSGGVLLWVQYRRKVRDEAAALEQKKIDDEKARQEKISERSIARAELIDQIGNSLLSDLRAELTRSNEDREHQRRELASQGLEIKDMRIQIGNLQEADRRHRHNEHEMVRHIEVLELGYPYPPGPPARPRWDLLTPPQGPATA
jgi:hypothetical protein